MYLINSIDMTFYLFMLVSRHLALVLTNRSLLVRLGTTDTPHIALVADIGTEGLTTHLAQTLTLYQVGLTLSISISCIMQFCLSYDTFYKFRIFL